MPTLELRTMPTTDVITFAEVEHYAWQMTYAALNAINDWETYAQALEMYRAASQRYHNEVVMA